MDVACGLLVLAWDKYMTSRRLRSELRRSTRTQSLLSIIIEAFGHCSTRFGLGSLVSGDDIAILIQTEAWKYRLAIIK